MQSAECRMDGGRIGWPEMPVAGNRKSESRMLSPELPRGSIEEEEGVE